MRSICLRALLCLACAAPALAQPKDAGDISKPSLITLKLTDVPPKQIFEEIAKQAQTEFLLSPKTLWTTVTSPQSLAAENQPFWLVMKEVCSKAEISLKYATDTAEPKIILARDKQNWTQLPAVASGPFLVSLRGLQRSSFVDMHKPTEVQRTFMAKMTVFCEPRVRLLRASMIAKVESATDDKGNSLAIKTPDADEATMNFVTSWVYNLDANLEFPKDAGTKVTSLKCSAKFIAQTKSETIEIADPTAAKGTVKSIAGRKITLKELRRSDAEWEAVMTLGRDQLTAEQWAGALFPGQSLKLLDAEGRSVVAKGFGVGGKGDELSFIFKFEKDPPKASRIGKPVKLVWEVPTETKELFLSFEFKDVPLP